MTEAEREGQGTRKQEGVGSFVLKQSIPVVEKDTSDEIHHRDSVI